MISKETKISKMLDAHPETLEVLLQASAHFSKLKNKVLRKTLAARVTVKHAAAVAGIPLNDLLLNLNSAIGKKDEFLTAFDSRIEADAGEINSTGKPGILNDLTDNKIFVLDVRKDIAGGSDPLKEIIRTVKQLKEDDVLLLINSFEPVPLYTVLKRKGYEHWAERNNSEWRIYFYKNRKGNSLTDEKEKAAITPDITGEEKIDELDVRDLEPPEPMVRILEKISVMDEDTVLLVHHHREPVMLYPKMEERGFGAITNKINDNYFKVLIKKIGK